MENSKAIGILQAVKAGTADIFISKAAINDALDMAIAALEQQEKAFDEWCTDCKEYDHNRHCCPRYNRVIRGAVDEVNGNLAKEKIEAEPAAEVVPVVRCRDCKYWDNGNLSFECPWDYGRHGSSDEDDFCSYGERREE